jgi:hypothetical protein
MAASASMTNGPLFPPRNEGDAVTYVSDFGDVRIPADLYDRVAAMDDEAQARWERGLKRHISDAWVSGVPLAEIVL